MDSKVDSRIYIVVPVFNRISYTERFLYCIRKQTFNNFEIIVIDDNSTDGTSELIKEQFKEVTLLHGDGNLWWTGAINMGIQYALRHASQYDLILVINDDLEINPDYLETLHSLHKSMPQTLIGSVVVDIENPDLIDDGGVTVNWLTAKYRMLNYKKNLSDFKKNHFVDVSLLTGRGTLIPSRTFREIGLFREDHFQQCGDTEFPVRAKNSGYRLIVSYAAIVKSHIESSYNMNVSKYYWLKDAKNYFFDIKSNFRLKYRFFFSLDTARNPVFFVSFFLFDLLRITYHFLLRLRLFEEDTSDI